MNTTTTTTSNPLALVAIIVLFVAIIGVVLYLKIKRRNATWAGVVIDKNMTETASSPASNGDSGSGITITSGRTAVNRTYTLRIKGDTGTEFNWTVGEGFYNSVVVGDRLTKSPGTETPTKL